MRQNMINKIRRVKKKISTPRNEAAEITEEHLAELHRPNKNEQRWK